MGEAKRRRNASGGEFQLLDHTLHQMGIDTSQFGFYDQPAFVESERKDPSLLELYARWIKARPRDAAYEQHVREIVPRVAEALADAFRKDNFIGSCVPAAMMLSRILDRLEVWSFGVRGSLILEHQENKLWRGLQVIDDPDFPNAALGHAWVVAPPYKIVDASIALQRWAGDLMAEYVPPYVLVENDARIVRPEVTDIVSMPVQAKYAASEGRVDPDLHHRLQPGLKLFGRYFPALETITATLRLRYVPVAVSVSDVPLEEINSEGSSGRSGAAIWTEVVAPLFGR